MFLTVLADTSGSDSGALVGMVIFFLCMGAYFAPAIVARDKRNFGSVLALNFFLGWTIVGWVVALSWALMKDSPAGVIQQTAAPHPMPSAFCSACGKYSQGGSKFCQNCGQPLVVTQGS